MKKSKNRFFFFVLTTLCVLLCVVVSHFFANIISTSSFSFSTISASVSEYSLFAVSAKSFTIKSQATEFSATLKSKNSGSYVYETNGKFYVLCSIYEHENDAKNVVENILENFPNAEVVKIDIDGINFGNFSNQNFKKTFTDVFNCLKQTYLSLYDISVSLDTEVYSPSKAILECSKTKDALNNAFNNLPTGTNATEGAYYVLIKNKIKKINQSLDDLINFTQTESYTLSSKLKDTYINIVIEVINLIDEINEK